MDQMLAWQKNLVSLYHTLPVGVSHFVVQSLYKRKWKRDDENLSYWSFHFSSFSLFFFQNVPTQIIVAETTG